MQHSLVLVWWLSKHPGPGCFWVPTVLWTKFGVFILFDELKIGLKLISFITGQIKFKCEDIWENTTRGLLMKKKLMKKNYLFILKSIFVSLIIFPKSLFWADFSRIFYYMCCLLIGLKICGCKFYVCEIWVLFFLECSIDCSKLIIKSMDPIYIYYNNLVYRWLTMIDSYLHTLHTLFRLLVLLCSVI